MANKYLHLADTIADVTTSSYDLRKTASAYAKIGQDFQPAASGYHTAFRLRLLKTGSPTGNIWIKVYAAGANPTAGTLLATSNNVDVSTVATGYTLFVLPSILAKTSATQYYIVLDGDYTVSATNYISWYRNTSSSYASGTAWTFDGSTWTSQASADMSLVAFDNADGGYFDLNTSVNVSTLRTTIKGAAIASSDTILVYNGATLTQDENMTLLIGQAGKSVGATGTTVADASSGQRSGNITVNPGINTSFLGSATNTSSGFSSVLTATDSTSKNSTLTIGTPTGAACTLNNVDNTLDTNKRWMINWPNGQVKIYKSTCLNSWGNPITCTGAAALTANAPVVNDCTLNCNTANSALITLGSVLDLACDFRRNAFNNTINSSWYGIGSTSTVPATGGSIDYAGSTFSGSAATVAGSYPVVLKGGVVSFYANGKIAFDAIAPTQIIPTNLTFTDMQDGTVKVETGNIASYGASDRIFIYNASNVAVGSFSKTMYLYSDARKPANCGILYGLPLGVLSGYYAKASSDNQSFSNASSVASDITLTFAPSTADVRNGVPYGQNASEFSGSYIATGGDSRRKKDSFKNY